MSMGGMAVATGLVIDAVVVAENIHRRFREGGGAEAVEQATGELVAPIAGSKVKRLPRNECATPLPASREAGRARRGYTAPAPRRGSIDDARRAGSAAADRAARTNSSMADPTTTGSTAR